MKTVHYTAAGGVVIDRDRVLVLRRPSRDEVRLPKGHIETGESPRQAALREVTEESGYAALYIVADLGAQEVEFDYQDKHVVRSERYFAMRLEREGDRPPCQVEREPGEFQFIPDWLGWDEALAALTFEVEREWLRRARSGMQTGPARAPEVGS